MPGAFAGGLAINQPRSCNPKSEALAKLVQAVDACFGIIDRHVGQRLLQRLTDLYARRRRGIGTRIEQIIQQQRMRAQAFGHPAAAGHHFHQTRQCGGLLIQQGEVAGTAKHRLHQGQAPFGHGIGCGAARGGGQQGRQHAIQPCPRACGQGRQRRQAMEALQLAHQCLRVAEADVGKMLYCIGIVRVAPDLRQARHLRARIARRPRTARLEHA